MMVYNVNETILIIEQKDISLTYSIWIDGSQSNLFTTKVSILLIGHLCMQPYEVRK